MGTQLYLDQRDEIYDANRPFFLFALLHHLTTFPSLGKASLTFPTIVLAVTGGAILLAPVAGRCQCVRGLIWGMAAANPLG